MSVIRQSELPFDRISRDFVGRDHGGIGFTFLIVDAGPGEGPALHRHPYAEVLIVLEGSARATLDDEAVDVGEGDIVVVPANVAHRFVNTGTGRLRQIDIHDSPHFVTQWLKAPDG
jgi:mannose-6-phosphate isomerase-like protein (cupin superfamily)